VTRSDFEAALRGIDPHTGVSLARLGGKNQNHTAGWDVTFSAPKSVSVLWALSDAQHRPIIERAQSAAVTAASTYLERSAAFARRGKGGAIREPTTGLLLAEFDHHTSRELDPQLHTHVFVFNLAPRNDGTWGAIVSRDLYKAQKQAGAVYREALATELERAGFAIERTSSNFRVTTISRDIERAYSKRRVAIESAAEAHGYRSAKGMELAALRTRGPKRDVSRQQLFEAWRAEAKVLGFDLAREELIRSTSREGHARSVPANPRPVMVANVRTERPEASVPAAIGKLSNAARALDQRASMPGVAVELAQRERLTKRRRREPERQ